MKKKRKREKTFRGTIKIKKSIETKYLIKRNQTYTNLKKSINSRLNKKSYELMCAYRRERAVYVFKVF